MAEKSEKNRGERQPKRIIHFSDSDVPEYSSDEGDSLDTTATTCIVHIDPSSLGWIDWLRFKTGLVGNTALQICDYLGDSLSSFFGITTPKYQFEIDHFNMMKKLESEFSDTEMAIVDKSVTKSDNLA